MSQIFQPLDGWFVTGATASGKTAVGCALAERIGGEVISVDSMAVYQGLDIGTAKPTPAERKRVAHHLIDVLPPTEEFSLAQYLALAHQAAADVRSRGREVVFVGGTPLYLKALLRGLYTGPAPDWQFRAEMAARAASERPGWLHAQVARVDPAAAARLHPGDRRRLIRALEVYHLTGTPLSTWQQQFEQARPAEACRVFWLDWPRPVLYARIEARVDAMFDAGLVEEVHRLLAAGVHFSRTARQALGYREVLEHLHSTRDLAATVALVKTRSRQFAKRQLTWLRSLSECRRIELAEPLEADCVVARLIDLAGCAAHGRRQTP
jgi:tRNA dimethylallyltransferase